MNNESVEIPTRGCPRQTRRCVVASLIIMAALPALAQDLKSISSSLSSRIAASGRRTVAVIDFTDLQGNVTELGRFLAEELSVELVSDAKGFEVIDRTHLKAILQEHKLAATGLIDPQTARQLGQIAGVDALVTGTITALGDSVRLSVKVLDTTTARMIAASTTDVPKTKAIEELLAKGIGSPQPASPPLSPASPNTSTSRPSNAFTAEFGEFLVVVRACVRSGELVTCSGQVTNRGSKRADFRFEHRRIYLVDELGNKYSNPRIEFGTGGVDYFAAIAGTPYVQQSLDPNLPLNFSLAFSDVATEARFANVIIGDRTIRNIPIQQK